MTTEQKAKAWDLLEEANTTLAKDTSLFLKTQTARTAKMVLDTMVSVKAHVLKLESVATADCATSEQNQLEGPLTFHSLNMALKGWLNLNGQLRPEDLDKFLTFLHVRTTLVETRKKGLE